jgi:hypothetical protein
MLVVFHDGKPKESLVNCMGKPKTKSQCKSLSVVKAAVRGVSEQMRCRAGIVDRIVHLVIR